MPISSLLTIELIDHQVYWPSSLSTIKPIDHRPSSLSTIEPIDHWAYQPMSISTIEPINHWAYRPSSLSTIEAINHWANWPSSLSTIEPINLWSSFATFKPFSLFSFELDLPLQVTKAKVLFKVSGQLSLQKKGIMHNALWIINDYAGTAFLFTFLSE